MRSRDRGKKRAGKDSRPNKVNAEVLQRLREVCQLARQQNTELLAQLRRQREAILMMRSHGPIQ